ncbi:glycosyltransferase [Pontibacter indicus]|uniref:glycosyltransferase n=1 Tax=Pontibacter indicus TaxID=1317125 RepID=UPI00097691DE|nr:glycosyltransferase [Pontibacter indicus]
MKIRILFIQETISSGGVERRRYSLVKFLPKEKYEIKIICTKSLGPLVENIKEEGVEVIEIGVLSKVWDTDKYKAVLKVIKAYKPHIIHGAVFEGVLLSTIAGYMGRVPIIIAEETSDPQNRSIKASYLLKILSLIADKFIAIAPNVGNYLKEVARVSPSKIKVITNGVSLPRPVTFHETTKLRNSLGIQVEDFVIGSVGRLFDDHKKFTDIIKAISLLSQRSNIKLLIIGDGKDKEFIKREAESLGLSRNLVMVGFQSDTAPYYKLMNIFCLASQREGFGLVAAEAMFHELPVVATKVGGLQDIVVNNETGILVNANRPEQIATAIDKLFSNQDLIISMGKKGRLRAEKEYSAERYVKEVEEMYKELLRQKQII